MKTQLTRLLLLSLAALVAAVPSAYAQRQLGKKKGPTSKIYLAEVIGDSQIQAGEKIYTARQATAFDAPGTVIETTGNSQMVFVFSNGTGMTVGENSRLEINRFEQAPFAAGRNTSADTTVEPSVSLSDLYLARGTVGIATSEFVSGSSMLCTTPMGSLNVRGGKISIITTDNETIIDLLEGDATVRGGDKDLGGYVMRPGERVILRRDAPGQAIVITVSRIPLAAMQTALDLVTRASNARNTVTFEAIERKAEEGLDGGEGAGTPAGTTPGPSTAEGDAAGADGDQEIVAKPTVPAQPPTHIVISPDRLPGN